MGGFVVFPFIRALLILFQDNRPSEGDDEPWEEFLESLMAEEYDPLEELETIFDDSQVTEIIFRNSEYATDAMLTPTR